MAASEENSALFLIFILTMMALPLVLYTLLKLCHLYAEESKSIHCNCSVCSHSEKYRISIFKKISNFSTYSNLTLVLLWIIMVGLIYHIKNTNHVIQVFDPFSILGLEPGSPDSGVKKAYRRLSIQYHPDKNSDPEAHQYFVEYISKAYQALTDPGSCENYEKYNHPDGRQGLQMGIALPEFLLSVDGTSGKVIKVFTKASEYLELPFRRIDEEPLQKLFILVRSELNSDLKNIHQEQAKFWKQHPAMVKTELLIQA